MSIYGGKFAHAKVEGRLFHIGKGECFIEGDRFFHVPAHDVGKGVGLQHGRSAGLYAALFGGGDAFVPALFDVFAFLLCGIGEDLQHKVGDEPACQVFRLRAGISKGLIRHHDVRTDGLCDARPLYSMFRLFGFSKKSMTFKMR